MSIKMTTDKYLLNLFSIYNTSNNNINNIIIILYVCMMLVLMTHSGQKYGSVKIAGDMVLGGLFPVHEKGDNTSCGLKIYDRGVLRLEAMLFAIDKINSEDKILPNITLGVNILDTCSRETYALNQSLEFIRASRYNLDASAYQCADNSIPHAKYNHVGNVVGVIGGSYSSVTLQVANLLHLFRIPQISPASTAKSLSDKKKFGFFARTVPPDTFQSKALVDIVKTLNWTYVSTVYSEGSYGEYGIEVFNREAQERNVCIATGEKVPSTADDSTFEVIVKRLKKKANSNGVILFTRAEDARRILQAAKRLNDGQILHWIASDGWGKQGKLIEGVEDMAEGAITVELHSEPILEFEKYMEKLTPETNIRNPWFSDYWEEVFACILPNNIPLETNQTLKVCDPHLKLTEVTGYEQESKVQFVVDAVYAFGLAYHNLHQDVCQNNEVCPELINYDGGEFYNKYLLNVSFIDLAGSEVKFDKNGDGLARYDILNYQKVPNGSGYLYKTVGKWSKNLILNLSDIIWANGSKSVPISVCSLPCPNGYIRKQQGETCCWVCDKCEDHEFVSDEYTCEDCGYGYWPNKDKNSCYALNVQYLVWESPYAYVPAAVSVIGMIITSIVISLFIKYNDTPLVRASGRELSYLLLFGIFICYLNTFALIAKPTTFTCISQRLGIGIGFSIVYGALLTKTNRISRIFDAASKSALRPIYISPKSQVVITSSLILVQFAITTLWMIVEPPGTRYYYPDRKHVILRCRIHDMSFLISQLYNIILITICTVYAVKTRAIPENFNESKFIGLTMYTTCIIWLAFAPIYFSTSSSYEMQISTLCISISLSATVALVCLYWPKIYIVVFHPDKNVRKLTMNSATYKKSTIEATPTYNSTGASGTGATDFG